MKLVLLSFGSEWTVVAAGRLDLCHGTPEALIILILQANL